MKKHVGSREWLRPLFPVNKQVRRRKPGCRPLLELLEDRTLFDINLPNVATFVAQGPNYIRNGQVDGMTDDPVVGSVHVLAAHPNDANILFAGGSNGGVWRTLDALAANPTWTPLTDGFPSLTMGAMEMNPANPNEIIVGVGGFASGGFDNLGAARGDQIGALYTTNALAANPTWTVLSEDIAGQNASGVAARNGYLAVAGTAGVFRSTDGGANFDLLSGGTLPNGQVFDMVGDPNNPNRYLCRWNVWHLSHQRHERRHAGMGQHHQRGACLQRRYHEQHRDGGPRRQCRHQHPVCWRGQQRPAGERDLDAGPGEQLECDGLAADSDGHAADYRRHQCHANRHHFQQPRA
jgi:hypothetical protein